MSSSNAYAIREEDKFFYEELSPAEQFHVDRIIARYIEQATNKNSNIELSTEEKRLISRLTDEERELMAKIVESRLTGGLDYGLTIVFSRDDEFWYNSLSEQHRALVDAIVMKNVEARQVRSVVELSSKEDIYYQSLGSGEKQIVERLITATLEKSTMPATSAYWPRVWTCKNSNRWTKSK